ncbi:hypothetical protein [Niveibacterium sp. SC-1]|uniref:hypothetical protein n=1 Tax=Niveibacterium sp. SC-1 TaxID=3135646 RepID=UPI00311DF27D
METTRALTAMGIVIALLLLGSFGLSFLLVRFTEPRWAWAKTVILSLLCLGVWLFLPVGLFRSFSFGGLVILVVLSHRKRVARYAKRNAEIALAEEAYAKATQAAIPPAAEEGAAIK